MSVVVRQLINAPLVAEPAHLQGPAAIFLLPALLAMWRQVLGWNGITASSGNLTLVGFEKSTAVGRMFFSMPYGGYGGVIGEGTEADFQEIARWLRSRNYLQENIVQFQSPPAGDYPNTYYRNKLVTHIIDLDGSTSGYSENAKRNVKRAQAQQFKIVRLDFSGRAQFLALLESHQKRTREVRRMPRSCYEYLLSLGDKPDSGISICAAVNDSGLQCVHIYFATAADAFYFDGFSSQDGLDAGANFLLLDEMIRDFRSAGVQRLNLGATPPLDKGLRRFKEGWGAAEIEYVEYSRRSQLKRMIDFMTRIR